MLKREIMRLFGLILVREMMLVYACRHKCNEFSSNDLISMMWKI